MTQKNFLLQKALIDSGELLSGNSGAMDFFCEFSDGALQNLPFDFEDQGLQTTFDKIDFVQKKKSKTSFDATRILNLEGRIHNDRELYVFDLSYVLNDSGIRLELKSLYKEHGLEQRNFAPIFLGQQQNFLEIFDRTRIKFFNDQPAQIILLAKSGTDDRGNKTNGGYVWANQGFDFDNKAELQRTRVEFKQFAAQRGLIISDQDLQKFSKPCHFAAFDNGIKTASENQELPLGKAFMAEHFWMAKWENKNPKAEEKRYAAAFNQPGLQAATRPQMALAELNQAYRNMQKKHQLHAKANDQRRELSTHQPLWQQKMQELGHYISQAMGR